MPGNSSNITTTLQPDPPLVQSAAYRFDANDRQFIDNQILGVQKHLATNLINGVVATYATLDSSSAAGSVGDVVCLASSGTGNATVTRALTAALAVAGGAYGIMLTAAAPGSTFLVALCGIIPPTVTGLAAGASGVVKVNGATARGVRAAAFTTGDFPLGIVDSTGYLDLNPTYAVVGGAPSGAAGGDLAGTYPNPTVSQGTGTGGFFNVLATPKMSANAKNVFTEPSQSQSTSSTALATIMTLALAGLTGTFFVQGIVQVTDSTATNIGTWTFKASYKIVSGTPTLLGSATITSEQKAGTITGNEITLAISGTNVLVQTTPAAATAWTWTANAFSSPATF